MRELNNPAILPPLRNRPFAATDRLDAREPRWFALRTAHHHEKRALAQLQRDGIECFLPLQDSVKRYTRKIVRRQRCLLPGYVFVRITAQHTAAIHRNPWVKFLTVGKDRLDIPETEIEMLRRITGEKSLELEWELVNTDQWQDKQAVELIGGPLTGTKGTFINTHNKGILIIELGLLPVGMGLQTMVPAGWVRPLGVNLRTVAPEQELTA